MNDHQFAVSVSSTPDQVKLELVGWMDFDTSGKFRTAMMDATRKDWSNVVVDCRRLEYIDSSAMGIVFLWHTRLQEHEKSISLINCTGAVLQAFKMAGFHKIFSVS